MLVVVFNPLMACRPEEADLCLLPAKIYQYNLLNVTIRLEIKFSGDRV